MSDLLNSLLVKGQVPEFVREEHPLFVSFLEAYYEFLENKQGTQNNDLLTKSKSLRNVSDIDISINDFENQFFNTFASFLPRDGVLDKELMIKNLLPLYLSKGSEKSFKLLFRMLFGQELQVIYPRNSVLRASDGKWLVENTIRVITDVYSPYIGNGTKREFLLSSCRCPRTGQSLPINIRVFINGSETSDYYIRTETKKIIFNTVPTNGSIIEIYYVNFDLDTIVNRKITGKSSGSTAIVEKYGQQIQNNRLIYDLFVDPRNINGTFSISEELLCDTIHPNGELVPLVFQALSTIESIELIDGGSNYLVGDQITFSSIDADIQPRAVISRTFSGRIDGVDVNFGGSGFQAGLPVLAEGYEPTQLFFAIGSVDDSGANTINTYSIFSSVITDIDPSNTVISTPEWYFPGNTSPTGNVSLSTVISRGLNKIVYEDIGPITNVQVLLSATDVEFSPNLIAQPATVVIEPQTANTTGNTILTIDIFGSLGRLNIVDGGADYEEGDEIIFTNRPMDFGFGAEAEVTQVSVSGEITKVSFVPSKITGTANVSSVSNVMVQGNSTLFEIELLVGDEIMINGETKTVVSISSNTSLNVNSVFSQDFTEKYVRSWSKNLVGGFGYSKNNLPTVSVASEEGSGAVIEITSILGDNEDLSTTTTTRPGEIAEVLLIDPGESIRNIPKVDLTQQGDGNAIVEVRLNDFVKKLDGRWTTSDSLLSSADIKIQGRDYYINQAYVLSSQVEFAKYKTIFKELLHPAGFKPYAELTTFNIIETTDASVDKLTTANNTKVLAGTVTLNSSVYVVGTGTKFLKANTLGLISVGSEIAVNTQIRTVANIISNTVLTVTETFTVNTAGEDIIVLDGE